MKQCRILHHHATGCLAVLANLPLGQGLATAPDARSVSACAPDASGAVFPPSHGSVDRGVRRPVQRMDPVAFKGKRRR